MVKIPVELFVKQYLHLGSVLYFNDENMPHPHYYIIINKYPLEDDLLIMPMGGSDYQKICEMVRFKDGNDKAFVYIRKGESAIFPKETGIDCGQLNNLTSERFMDLYQRVSLEWKGDLEPEILEKLVAATKGCRRVASVIKDLL